MRSCKGNALPVSVLALVATALVGVGCLGKVEPPAPATRAVRALAGGGASEKETVLVFAYGSEKEPWIKDVTKGFNEAGKTTASGKRIRVEAVPMGSGESVNDVLEGRLKAHLTSPASSAYLEIANARSKAAGKGDLVGPPRNLVLSPVVIAVWKSMADALGKGGKEIGWADVQALAKDPKGWAAVGRGEWGEFRFAHTHPQYSNSGLIALLAQAYAATGKTKGLTKEDVADPKVAKYIEEIQRSVVHYGRSTGFFGKKMAENGKGYLSAGVLYENMVIEANAGKMPEPLVAVYPREGTFWSDHPIGVIQRDWVTDEHKEAAKVYIDYLLAKPQQVKAMQHGFRPGDESIPLDAPLDRAHGIDPDQPKKLLTVPPAEVMEALLALWPKVKKPTRVVLVLDVSGSMRLEQRMTMAQAGAQELVGMLNGRDIVSLMAFSNAPRWVRQDVKTDAAGKKELNDAIGALFPSGETALYDAVAQAWQTSLDKATPEVISAVVVLTDGEDNRSKVKLDALLGRIKADFEKTPARVFTIAYGRDANLDVLKKIADATQARSYKGEPKTISEVLRDIATFF
jgi:Ca-activated chloride channel family protein